MDGFGERRELREGGRRSSAWAGRGLRRTLEEVYSSFIGTEIQ